MSVPLQITIRDNDNNNAKYLTHHIQEKAHKLDQYYHDITSCRIVVEPAQHNQHQGNLHAVHIDLTIPKDKIIINKIEDENVYVAIRDALNAACRRLQSQCGRKHITRHHRTEKNNFLTE